MAASGSAPFAIKTVRRLCYPHRAADSSGSDSAIPFARLADPSARLDRSGWQRGPGALRANAPARLASRTGRPACESAGRSGLQQTARPRVENFFSQRSRAPRQRSPTIAPGAVNARSTIWEGASTSPGFGPRSLHDRGRGTTSPRFQPTPGNDSTGAATIGGAESTQGQRLPMQEGPNLFTWSAGREASTRQQCTQADSMKLKASLLQGGRKCRT